MLNKAIETTAWGSTTTRYEYTLWRIQVAMIYRTGGTMGRFGGWNWSVGLKLGGRTLLFDLLVCSLSITFMEKDHV